MSRKHWDAQASNWAAWARTPGFDEYWSTRRSLSTSCRRRAAARSRLDAAKAVSYVRCDSAALPFADASFDLVVLDNVLMDVDDMEGSVLREAARVLRAQGTLCACVTHPTADSGRISGPAGGSSSLRPSSAVASR
jgi:SAM-dependent methyltransferase